MIILSAKKTSFLTAAARDVYQSVGSGPIPHKEITEYLMDSTSLEHYWELFSPAFF